MRPGTLRHLIKFLAVNKTKNDFGETIESFQMIGTAKAAIVKNRLENDIVADGKSYPTVKTFHLRYKPWITSDLLIEYDNKKFTILSVDDVNGLRRELYIYAEAF